MTFQSQAEAKRVIQASIDTNDRAVLRALKLIYAKQTEHEKESERTHDANGVGFSAFDAEILTSFCNQLQERSTLSDKQMAIARKKIRKYWKQLAIMSGGLKVAA